MKKPLLLYLFAVLTSGSFVCAQSREYVTGFGFNTEVNSLVPLSGNRWLAICTGVKEPGDIFADTVVAAIFDSRLNQMLEKRLPLSVSEVHLVKGVLALPDGGFAVSVSFNLCDADYPRKLMAFDQNGNEKWTQQTTYIPDLLKVSPDGKLIGIDYFYNKLMVFNPENGVLESTADLTATTTKFNLIFLNNGSDEFLAIGNPTLQLWQKASSGIYTMVNSATIPSLSYPNMIVHVPAQNKFYVGKSGYDGLVRIDDPYLLNFQLIGNNNFKIHQLLGGDTSFISIVSNSQSDYFAVRMDSLGNIIHLVRTFPDNVTPVFAAGSSDTLVIAGKNVSGLKSTPATPPLESRQLWVNTILNENSTQAETADVQLQGIYNSATLVTHIIISAPHDTAVMVTGGHFYAQIKNNGSTILKSLDLKVGFNWYTDAGCGYRPVQLVHYSGLHLAPGDSTLLDFGALSPGGRVDDLKSLCFWTSAPNHLPDANPQDDIFCKSLLVLDAEEPYIQSVPWLSPNPTTRTLRVSGGKPLKNLRIFNISGTEMNGFPSEITDGTIDVGRLPAGVYFAVFLSEGVWEREKFIKL